MDPCDRMRFDATRSIRYDTIRRRRDPWPIVVAMLSSLRCRCRRQYTDPIFKAIGQKLAKIRSIECNTILVLSRDASRSRFRSEKRITLYSITYKTNVWYDMYNTRVTYNTPYAKRNLLWAHNLLRKVVVKRAYGTIVVSKKSR